MCLLTPRVGNGSCVASTVQVCLYHAVVCVWRGSSNSSSAQRRGRKADLNTALRPSEIRSCVPQATLYFSENERQRVGWMFLPLSCILFSHFLLGKTVTKDVGCRLEWRSQEKMPLNKREAAVFAKALCLVISALLGSETQKQELVTQVDPCLLGSLNWWKNNICQLLEKRDFVWQWKA